MAIGFSTNRQRGPTLQFHLHVHLFIVNGMLVS